jgi:uncharacterized protein with FMN-binding domain
MDTNPNPSGNKRLAAILGLVVIVAAIGAAAFAFSPKAASPTASASPSPAATSSSLAAASPTPTATAAPSSTYKDGTYKATGTYRSPGGTEKLGVTITIKGDTVTDSAVTNGATEPTGREYQTEFIAAYKSFVTGKAIDDISLSRVSGSSLTSGGFNDALSQIKSQAKA